jgi:ribonuclease P/MRP protein subunit POP3
MVALASESQPSETTIRLVGFSKPCEERLAASLGIPRVDFVRKHVAPIDVAWLKEAQSADYLETKIDAVQTKVGSKKPKLS